MNELTRRLVLFLGFLAVFSMLFPTLVTAIDDVELVISPDDITINTTETRSVDVIITNNQEVEDMFSVSVWPPTPWGGVSPNLEKSRAKIAAGSNHTIKLYLTVSSNAEEIISTFLVTAKSIAFENVITSTSINVRVRRKSSVYISDLGLDKYVLEPEGCIIITTSITNMGFSPGSYKLQTTIKKGTSIIQRFDDDIIELEGKSMEPVSNSYCFGKYSEAGTYSVEAVLRTNLNELMDSWKTSIRLNEVSDLVLKKSVIYTPFLQIKTIKIKNEGNVIESDFIVTETVSEFISKFFYPIDAPTSVTEVEDKVVYNWVLESLVPGAETQIKYEIRFISLWISGISLVLVVFFAFSYVYRPRISKTVRFLGPLKRGKEMVVMIEVKNSTIHEMKNIIIRDSVSPIVSLIEKFDTMAPAVKRSEAGITLTWKMKSLKPLEERVLTYRIKPKVDIIGSMRLPRATMEYVNNKKEKKTIASKSIEIK